MVHGEAVPAAVKRQAAAEEIADHADRRRGSVHDRESVRCHRLDDVAPAGAGPDPRDALHGIDFYRAPMQVETQQESVLERREGLAQVPGRLRRDGQAVLARIAERALHVPDFRGHADACGPLVDGEVPGCPGTVIQLVARVDKRRLRRRVSGDDGVGIEHGRHLRGAALPFS